MLKCREREYEEIGDRERECVSVGVCGGREGSNKVQGLKEGSNAPDGAGSKGFKRA
jgi:hypothetical protein